MLAMSFVPARWHDCDFVAVNMSFWYVGMGRTKLLFRRDVLVHLIHFFCLAGSGFPLQAPLGLTEQLSNTGKRQTLSTPTTLMRGEHIGNWPGNKKAPYFYKWCDEALYWFIRRISYPHASGLALHVAIEGTFCLHHLFVLRFDRCIPANR